MASSPPGLYSVGALLNNGRYRVIRRLNKGATAVVYAAEDLLAGCRPVALKVVQCGSNKVPLNVVRREVSLSSSVAHENMVQLLDVFAEGTELIIVWELISGGDLLELLNECNGCMTEPAAAFYYSQLLRGVLHMHAVGYCHRDIKPENCMIEASTQRLKLIDFGLSKHLESVATLGVGTPDYMPPEMVHSQIKQQQRQGQHTQQQQSQQTQPSQPPPYDAKAVDAWAMGVLLYLLVTGCYPFEDPAQPNNLAATLLNVRAGRCQPLPDGISPGCRAVISGLLCADPVKRTRLEDLAYNPWLLQSAAAHAARLGPLAAGFQATPAWILSADHQQNTAAAAAAAAPPACVSAPQQFHQPHHGPAMPLLAPPPGAATGVNTSQVPFSNSQQQQQHLSHHNHHHNLQQQQQQQQQNYQRHLQQQQQQHMDTGGHVFACDQMEGDAAFPVSAAGHLPLQQQQQQHPVYYTQQHHHQQQQQFSGVDADRLIDQQPGAGGSGVGGSSSSKERRAGGGGGGFNWLQSLVRKRP